MVLTFVCPNRSQVFQSAAYRIIDNKGVVADESGNKILDAKVALDDPCPYCGEKHVYAARELACPYSASDA